MLVRECVQKRLAKDLRGKSCWLHSGKSDLEFDQRRSGVITSPTVLVPILVWIQQNYGI